MAASCHYYTKAGYYTVCPAPGLQLSLDGGLQGQGRGLFYTHSASAPSLHYYVDHRSASCSSMRNPSGDFELEMESLV